MADYPVKPNTGALFGNTKKDKPTQPDWRGELHIDPSLAKECIDPKTGFIKVSVSAWNKQWDGGHYFSLAVAKPYVPQQSAGQYVQQAAPVVQAAPVAEVPDEDIPF